MTFLLKTTWQPIALQTDLIADAPPLSGEPKARLGSEVFVWFFENPREGARGLGLTAHGHIASIESIEDSRFLRLQIKINKLASKKCFGVAELLNCASQISKLERKIRGYSHRQLRHLSEDESIFLHRVFSAS